MTRSNVTRSNATRSIVTRSNVTRCLRLMRYDELPRVAAAGPCSGLRHLRTHQPGPHRLDAAKTASPDLPPVRRSGAWCARLTAAAPQRPTWPVTGRRRRSRVRLSDSDAAVRRSADSRHTFGQFTTRILNSDTQLGLATRTRDTKPDPVSPRGSYRSSKPQRVCPMRAARRVHRAA